MGDALKTRVGRVIAGGLHALIDRLEDRAPEAVMEQAAREVDAVVGEVRHELGSVAANRHLAQQRHAHLNREHETLSSNLDEALVHRREDLARAAVARQLDIEAQIPVLEATLADLARQEDELRGYVEALLAKRREMDESLAQLRRSRGAAVTPGGNGKAAGALDAAAGAFGRQTGAWGTLRDAGLQQAAQLKELDELVRSNKIEERLAQLKADKE